MKIIDSVLFYNELDLLFYRLNILDEYVDYFIIVESTHTFTGIPKPKFFDMNDKKYEKFKHKIINILIEPPFKFPDIQYHLSQQWENEYHQRNSLKIGIDKIMNELHDEDIILTSDVDEIPNPDILKKLKNHDLSYDKNVFNRLAMDMYYYNLYYRAGEGSNWHGIKLMTLSAYKNNNLSFQQMRVWEHTNYVPVISNGGWHLSYFGNIDFIKTKISSYSHTEYNNHLYINDSLTDKINNGINLLNDTKLVYIPLEENKNLPYKYEIYLQKYT